MSPPPALESTVGGRIAATSASTTLDKMVHFVECEARRGRELRDRLSGRASPRFQRLGGLSRNLPFLGHVKALAGIDEMRHFIDTLLVPPRRKGIDDL